MWHVGILSAIYVLAEGCGSAFGHVGGVGDVLSVNEEEFVSHVLVLLFSEESVFE